MARTRLRIGFPAGSLDGWPQPGEGCGIDPVGGPVLIMRDAASVVRVGVAAEIDLIVRPEGAPT